MRRFLIAAALVFALSSVASAVPAIVPDNGSGTAHMPIRAPYYSQNPMNIIDGLPAATTVQIDAVLNAPTVTDEVSGGILAGTASGGGGAPLFTWTMQGTGLLAGYNRVLSFPINPGGDNILSFPSTEFDAGDPFGAPYEIHAAPRIANAPIQSFPINLFRGFDQITNPSANDPDFDLLRVVMGTDFGLPSPGHTILTSTDDGRWAVDSCIEMTYRIDFVGRPGGTFAGMSGSTTGVALMQAGDGGGPCLIPEPSSMALVSIAGLVALLAMHRRLGAGKVRGS
jgi:hypothetical protein